MALLSCHQSTSVGRLQDPGIRDGTSLLPPEHISGATAGSWDQRWHFSLATRAHRQGDCRIMGSEMALLSCHQNTSVGRLQDPRIRDGTSLMPPEHISGATAGSWDQRWHFSLATRAHQWGDCRILGSEMTLLSLPSGHIVRVTAGSWDQRWHFSLATRARQWGDCRILGSEMTLLSLPSEHIVRVTAGSWDQRWHFSLATRAHQWGDCRILGSEMTLLSLPSEHIVRVTAGSWDQRWHFSLCRHSCRLGGRV